MKIKLVERSSKPSGNLEETNWEDQKRQFATNGCRDNLPDWLEDLMGGRQVRGCRCEVPCLDRNDSSFVFDCFMVFASLSMTLIAPSVWWWTLSTHFEESRSIGYGKAWVSGTLRLRSLKPINGEKTEKCPRTRLEKKDHSSRNPRSKKFGCSRSSLKK